ncbi:ExbD/TolR family protein [Brumimicrobium mesophilum]|uniref:ExbD/TolR family protein n=1 Tax=Brumimicrobium mesophilum TaxID=392717 RepID=UPI000D14269C|nr:biopolymer transporter ExbD [Brumimicrobium mesophilum]
MGFGTQNKIKIEGGMASMTDLVFLLLVFFIIMSTMSEKNTPVELPQPSETMDTSMENTTTTVVITEDDLYQIMLSDASESTNPYGVKTDGVSYEEIREFLILEVEKTPEMKVKIAGARKASYEAVFQILALSKTKGWKPVLAYD